MAQERILIVEGDIALLEMLKTRVEAMGYLVSCARGGKQALDILKSKWIDLIVLSIITQDKMDGFHFLKEIKKKESFSKIPIIVESSKIAMKKTFERSGADSFFTKPISIEAFLNEIKDMLTKKVLVVGDEAKTAEAIVRALAEFDFNVDVLNNLNKFASNVTSYRYNLIVLQSKVRTTAADRLVSNIRESAKNRNTPIIVYTTRKITDMDAREARRLKSIKEKCRKMSACEFMDRSYSSRHFLELSKKYLEPE